MASSRNQRFVVQVLGKGLSINPNVRMQLCVLDA